MFRTVLVPIDGSPLAERALPYARRLARAADGRILLLQVVPTFAGADGVRAARDYLEGLATQDPGSPVGDTVVTVGDPASSILEEIERRGVDLIVMSTHGRSGLGRWIYGSVADEVMRRAPVPVLLVPATGPSDWPRDRPLRIMVPLDGSELAETILGTVGNLAGALDAELFLLRAVEPRAPADIDWTDETSGESPSELEIGRTYLDRITAHFRAKGLRVSVGTQSGLAVTTIVDVAREQKTDLIAMATHGSGGLTRLVMGSVATGVLQRAATPVLLVRPTATLATEPRPITVLNAHGIHELADAATGGDAQAARSLLVALAAPDVGAEILIRQELQQITTPLFWERLIEFLAIGSWAGRPINVPPSTALDREYLRRRARSALLLYPKAPADEAVRQALRMSLRNPEPEVQVVALELLGQRGELSASNDVIAALSSESMEVKEQAALALGRLGGEKAMTALIRALHADHDVVSGFAAHALSRIGSDAVPRLLEELGSPDNRVRWHVSDALAEIADPRAIDALLSALDDSDSAVRWNAARGLARMGKSALIALLRALEIRPLSSWFAQGAKYVLRHSTAEERSSRLQAVIVALRHPTASVEVPLRAAEALADLNATGVPVVARDVGT